MAVGLARDPHSQLPMSGQPTQPSASRWTDDAAFWLLGLLNNSGTDASWRRMIDRHMFTRQLSPDKQTNLF
jgi:hypothetical protein